MLSGVKLWYTSGMNWLKRLIRYPEIWILTIAALATRLFQLQLPPAIVFDETYFRTFAGHYLDGQYFFDIHPPLVKLVFAGFANILGLGPEQLINDDPAGVALRVLPALAGAALVPLVYIIIRQFGLGRRVATLGALFVLLDNALLVESRFILMDSILLLTGLGALASYLMLRRSTHYRRWVWVVITALLISLLVSTKWSGLAVAGLIAGLWLVDGVRRRIDWKRLVGEGLVTVLIVVTVYISLFMVHFALLPKTGDGDAFMSPKFRSLLIDSPVYDENVRMAFWDKFVELNEEMYTAQSSLNDVSHPYSSAWYTWPIQLRGVYYWQGPTTDAGLQGHIYLLGNPVVWWGSLLGVLSASVIWLARPRLLGARRNLVAFLLAGYAVNFVPFAFIDRPMFLYHYFFALVFAILLSCVLLSRLFDWQNRKYGKKAVTYTTWAIGIVTLLAFLYFLPISYGLPLSQADLQQRMWLSTWR